MYLFRFKNSLVYNVILINFAGAREKNEVLSNKEKGRLMLKYAMNYGVVLGAFWVFKYMFFMGSVSFRGTYLYFSDTLLYISLYLMPVITLSLSYVLVKRFRDNVMGGSINYVQCVIFGTLLFFFAALLEAALIYIHYKFLVDPQYMITRDKSWLEIALQRIFSREWLDAQKETYGTIIILISEIVKNVMIGFFLSSIYGIFVRTRANVKP